MTHGSVGVDGDTQAMIEVPVTESHNGGTSTFASDQRQNLAPTDCRSAQAWRLLGVAPAGEALADDPDVGENRSRVRTGTLPSSEKPLIPWRIDKAGGMLAGKLPERLTAT